MPGGGEELAPFEEIEYRYQTVTKEESRRI